MSKDAVRKFREALEVSDAIKDDIRALGKLSRADVVSVAGRHGFDFTVDELAEVSASMELKDFELEMIAGGAANRREGGTCM